MVPKEIGERWLEATNSWQPDDGGVYQATLQKLIAGKQCEYCGAWANTFDHIVPKSKGGPDSWDNLAFTCHSCNASKRARTLLEWIDHCNKMLRAAVRNDKDVFIWLNRLHGITGMIIERG